MPDGGDLEKRCSNIELPEGGIHVSDEIAAGKYVQTAVRDTGVGMLQEVLEHAFEPFYTTKEFGESSGLGLSMVCGFALQSGGGAVIDSEPIPASMWPDRASITGRISMPNTIGKKSPTRCSWQMWRPILTISNAVLPRQWVNSVTGPRI